VQALVGFAKLVTLEQQEFTCGQSAGKAVTEVQSRWMTSLAAI
jgi:hypothetical protein